MKLIYYANSIGSAYNSQVFELLQFLATKIDKVYLILSLKSNQSINIENVNIFIYRDIPEYPGCSFYHQNKLKKIFSDIQLDSQTIIHTRGHISASFVIKALGSNKAGAKVFPDIRGAISEEILYYSDLSPILKKLKLLMIKNAYRQIKITNGISLVSQSLEKYFASKAKMPHKVFINHCIAGAEFDFIVEQRLKIREELGFKQNDIVITFSSGGNNLWQMEQQIISSLTNLNVKILLLGYEGASTENIIRKKVPYADVPAYLSAADIGVLYREENIVNKVASPIKFSEYLACGLPVIANETVDHVVDIIEKTGFGMISKSFNNISNKDLEKLLEISRERISSWAKSYYGVSSIGSQYYENYKRLL